MTHVVHVLIKAQDESDNQKRKKDNMTAKKKKNTKAIYAMDTYNDFGGLTEKKVRERIEEDLSAGVHPDEIKVYKMIPVKITPPVITF